MRKTFFWLTMLAAITAPTLSTTAVQAKEIDIEPGERVYLDGADNNDVIRQSFPKGGTVRVEKEEVQLTGNRGSLRPISEYEAGKELWLNQELRDKGANPPPTTYIGPGGRIEREP